MLVPQTARLATTVGRVFDLTYEGARNAYRRRQEGQEAEEERRPVAAQEANRPVQGRLRKRAPPAPGRAGAARGVGQASWAEGGRSLGRTRHGRQRWRQHA